MADKYSVREKHDQRGFERAIIHQGGHIEHGAKHDRAYSASGAGPVSLPRHPGDYGRGLSSAITKQLLAIGLLLFPVACLLIWLLGRAQ